jgi:hypothetical protein
MTDSDAATGLIFLSHSSRDKDFVEQVIRQIPQSHLFYDIKTIDPGDRTIDALDEGLLSAAVFVLFVSPNTPHSVWVDYEASVAQFQKIRRQNLVVLTVPIKGASHKDAPTWMQSYVSANEKYSISDIARLIRYAFETSLRNQGLIRKALFVGRETLVNEILTEVRTQPVKTGLPVNFLILGGIQNMGRSTLAREVMPRIFPGSRNDVPVIDLGRHADALDFFLALRSDSENGLTAERLKELTAAWPAENPPAMAELIFANLHHFAEVNQTVVVRSARGLRDFGRDLNPSHCLHIAVCRF